jgi:hypothetical protein
MPSELKWQYPDNDRDGIIDGPKSDAACGPSSYCVDAECVHEDDCIEVTSLVIGSIGSELSGVWCSPSSEIVFANTVVIRPDAHIVIARGTTVRMDAATVTVRGRLEFHGTAAETIVVRSHKDTPNPGDWDTFRTDDACSSRRFYASHTTFSHARVAFSTQLPARADHCTFASNDVVAIEPSIYDDSNDPFIGRVFVAPILTTADPAVPADVP